MLGLEPSLHAWKARVLPVTPHPLLAIGRTIALWTAAESNRTKLRARELRQPWNMAAHRGNMVLNCITYSSLCQE